MENFYRVNYLIKKGKIIIFCFVFISIIQCSFDTKINNKITGNSVGEIHLMDTYEQVKQKLDTFEIVDDTPIKLHKNFEKMKYYNVYYQTDIIFTLYFVYDKLWTIRVFSDNYVTYYGVKIGDDFA